MKQYGICPSCHKWGDAPQDFDERYHFLRCSCGSVMFLNRTDPTEAAYRVENKIAIE